MVIRIVSVLLLACVMTGCAPGFGERVDVEELMPDKLTAPASVGYGECRVRVEQFSDNRPSDELIRIDGRPVLPEGLVAARITTAFEDALRLWGCRISQHEGVLLRGEVVDWIADVGPSFPVSKAKASAAIRITVLGENFRPLYSAVYNGDTDVTHPFLSESRVKSMLETAMETALEAALKDRGLQRFMSADREAGR